MTISCVLDGCSRHVGFLQCVYPPTRVFVGIIDIGIHADRFPCERALVGCLLNSNRLWPRHVFTVIFCTGPEFESRMGQIIFLCLGNVTQNDMDT